MKRTYRQSNDVGALAGLQNRHATAKRTPLRLAVLLITAAFSSGCIAARPFTLVKYDAKTDTFHELRIYVDIAGGTAAQNTKMTAEGLVAQWRVRDRYIPMLECLFLSADKTLCYYHEVSLAGTALDDSLRKGDVAARKELKEQVEQELASGRAHGKASSWEQLKNDLIADFDKWPESGMTFEGKKPNRSHPLTCLDETSLKMLLASFKAEQPIFARKGGELRLAGAFCRRLPRSKVCF